MFQLKNEYLAIGTMSGSSLDGLDIAAIQFAKVNKNWQYKLIACDCLPYSDEWKQKLKSARSISAIDLIKLNLDYGSLNAQLLKTFIQKNELNTIDCIASHGHTIYHNPKEKYTVQIGDGGTIARETNQIVINDLRAADVAAGGQGAPIVPIGDLLLFADYKACLNLGGIANVSIKKGSEIIAYDVCALNQVLNYLTEQLHLPYDAGGNLARNGSLNLDVFSYFVELDYHKKQAPKSMANEWIAAEIIAHIQSHYHCYAIPDLLHSFTQAMAYVLANDLNTNTDATDKLLVTGGGAYNDYLIELMQEQIVGQLVKPDNQLIEYKEAIVMALIGVLRLRGETNVLQCVTGASSDTCCGTLHIPN